MIKSMTGYGKAEVAHGEKKISVELRSLNSKQTDVNVRMPSRFKEKELVLRSELAKALGRGKIDLNIYVEGGHAAKAVRVNQELALTYFEDLKTLAGKIDEEPGSYLSLLVNMPEVLKAEKEELDEEEWEKVYATFRYALSKLDQFRMKEGKSLEKDFRNRINNIRELLEGVAGLEEERISGVKKRLNKSLEELLENDKIDRNRFEQELIYYLEKYDLNEEKVRLKNHCEYFLEILDGEQSQGKKLGFITQEIGREVNTIGSKANHSGIQKLVVQMKDEMEKIKEQVNNSL